MEVVLEKFVVDIKSKKIIKTSDILISIKLEAFKDLLLRAIRKKQLPLENNLETRITKEIPTSFYDPIFEKFEHIQSNLECELSVKIKPSDSKFMRCVCVYWLICRAFKGNFKLPYFVSDVSKFINVRNKLHIEVGPYTSFELNSQITHNINPMNKSSFFFKRKGGIISTNNLPRLLKNHFLESSNDVLFVFPQKISNLNINQISFSELETLRKKNLINKIIVINYDLNRIYIIKQLLNTLDIQIVWLLYGNLDLRAFGKLNRLDLNDLSSISNVWMGIDNLSKKSKRDDLLKFMVADYNKLYRRIRYPLEYDGETIEIKLGDFDSYVFDLLNTKLHKWMNGLTNDKSNRYSWATEKKISNLRYGLFNSQIYLLTTSEFKILDEMCIICCDVKMRAEAKMTCGHSLCLECFINTLSSTSECPFCRYKLSMYEVKVFHSEESEIQKFIKSNELLSDLDSVKMARENFKPYDRKSHMDFLTPHSENFVIFTHPKSPLLNDLIEIARQWKLYKKIKVKFALIK